MTRGLRRGSLALLLAVAAAPAPAVDRSPVRLAATLCDGRRDPVGVDPEAFAFRG